MIQKCDNPASLAGDLLLKDEHADFRATFMSSLLAAASISPTETPSARQLRNVGDLLVSLLRTYSSLETNSEGVLVAVRNGTGIEVPFARDLELLANCALSPLDLRNHLSKRAVKSSEKFKEDYKAYMYKAVRDEETPVEAGAFTNFQYHIRQLVYRALLTENGGTVLTTERIQGLIRKLRLRSKSVLHPTDEAVNKIIRDVGVDYVLGHYEFLMSPQVINTIPGVLSYSYSAVSDINTIMTEDETADDVQDNEDTKQRQELYTDSEKPVKLSKFTSWLLEGTLDVVANESVDSKVFTMSERYVRKAQSVNKISKAGRLVKYADYTQDELLEFTFNDIMSSKLRNVFAAMTGVRPDSLKQSYRYADFVRAVRSNPDANRVAYDVFMGLMTIVSSSQPIDYVDLRYTKNVSKPTEDGEPSVEEEQAMYYISDGGVKFSTRTSTSLTTTLTNALDISARTTNGISPKLESILDAKEELKDVQVPASNDVSQEALDTVNEALELILGLLGINNINLANVHRETKATILFAAKKALMNVTREKPEAGINNLHAALSRLQDGFNGTLRLGLVEINPMTGKTRSTLRKPSRYGKILRNSITWSTSDYLPLSDGNQRVNALRGFNFQLWKPDNNFFISSVTKDDYANKYNDLSAEERQEVEREINNRSELMKSAFVGERDGSIDLVAVRPNTQSDAPNSEMFAINAAVLYKNGETRTNREIVHVVANLHLRVLVAHLIDNRMVRDNRAFFPEILDFSLPSTMRAVEESNKLMYAAIKDAMASGKTTDGFVPARASSVAVIDGVLRVKPELVGTIQGLLQGDLDGMLAKLGTNVKDRVETIRHIAHVALNYAVSGGVYEYKGADMYSKYTENVKRARESNGTQVLADNVMFTGVPRKQNFVVFKKVMKAVSSMTTSDMVSTFDGLTFISPLRSIGVWNSLGASTQSVSGTPETDTKGIVSSRELLLKDSNMPLFGNEVSFMSKEMQNMRYLMSYTVDKLPYVDLSTVNGLHYKNVVRNLVERNLSKLHQDVREEITGDLIRLTTNDLPVSHLERFKMMNAVVARYTGLSFNNVVDYVEHEYIAAISRQDSIKLDTEVDHRTKFVHVVAGEDSMKHTLMDVKLFDFNELSNENAIESVYVRQSKYSTDSMYIQGNPAHNVGNNTKTMSTQTISILAASPTHKSDERSVKSVVANLIANAARKNQATTAIQSRARQLKVFNSILEAAVAQKDDLAQELRYVGAAGNPNVIQSAYFYSLLSRRTNTEANDILKPQVFGDSLVLRAIEMLAFHDDNGVIKAGVKDTAYEPKSIRFRYKNVEYSLSQLGDLLANVVGDPQLAEAHRVELENAKSDDERRTIVTDRLSYIESITGNSVEILPFECVIPNVWSDTFPFLLNLTRTTTVSELMANNAQMIRDYYTSRTSLPAELSQAAQNAIDVALDELGVTTTARKRLARSLEFKTFVRDLQEYTKSEIGIDGTYLKLVRMVNAVNLQVGDPSIDESTRPSVDVASVFKLLPTFNPEGSPASVKAFANYVAELKITELLTVIDYSGIRIPASSKASLGFCRVLAFSPSTINRMFAPAEFFWLQGADQDIDKASCHFYDVRKSSTASASNALLQSTMNDARTLRAAIDYTSPVSVAKATNLLKLLDNVEYGTSKGLPFDLSTLSHVDKSLTDNAQGKTCIGIAAVAQKIYANLIDTYNAAKSRRDKSKSFFNPFKQTTQDKTPNEYDNITINITSYINEAIGALKTQDGEATAALKEALQVLNAAPDGAEPSYRITLKHGIVGSPTAVEAHKAAVARGDSRAALRSTNADTFKLLEIMVNLATDNGKNPILNRLGINTDNVGAALSMLMMTSESGAPVPFEVLAIFRNQQFSNLIIETVGSISGGSKLKIGGKSVGDKSYNPADVMTNYAFSPLVTSNAVVQISAWAQACNLYGGIYSINQGIPYEDVEVQIKMGRRSGSLPSDIATAYTVAETLDGNKAEALALRKMLDHYLAESGSLKGGSKKEMRKDYPEAVERTMLTYRSMLVRHLMAIPKTEEVNKTITEFVETFGTTDTKLRKPWIARLLSKLSARIDGKVTYRTLNKHLQSDYDFYGRPLIKIENYNKLPDSVKLQLEQEMRLLEANDPDTALGIWLFNQLVAGDRFGKNSISPLLMLSQYNKWLDGFSSYLGRQANVAKMMYVIDKSNIKDSYVDYKSESPVRPFIANDSDFALSSNEAVEQFTQAVGKQFEDMSGLKVRSSVLPSGTGARTLVRDNEVVIEIDRNQMRPSMLLHELTHVLLYSKEDDLDAKEQQKKTHDELSTRIDKLITEIDRKLAAGGTLGELEALQEARRQYDVHVEEVALSQYDDPTGHLRREEYIVRMVEWLNEGEYTPAIASTLRNSEAYLYARDILTRALNAAGVNQTGATLYDLVAGNITSQHFSRVVSGSKKSKTAYLRYKTLITDITSVNPNVAGMSVDRMRDVLLTHHSRNAAKTTEIAKNGNDRSYLLRELSAISYGGANMSRDNFVKTMEAIERSTDGALPPQFSQAAAEIVGKALEDNFAGKKELVDASTLLPDSQFAMDTKVHVVTSTNGVVRFNLIGFPNAYIGGTSSILEENTLTGVPSTTRLQNNNRDVKYAEMHLLALELIKKLEKDGYKVVVGSYTQVYLPLTRGKGAISRKDARYVHGEMSKQFYSNTGGLLDGKSIGLISAANPSIPELLKRRELRNTDYNLVAELNDILSDMPGSGLVRPRTMDDVPAVIGYLRGELAKPFLTDKQKSLVSRAILEYENVRVSYQRNMSTLEGTLASLQDFSNPVYQYAAKLYSNIMTRISDFFFKFKNTADSITRKAVNEIISTIPSLYVKSYALGYNEVFKVLWELDANGHKTGKLINPISTPVVNPKQWAETGKLLYNKPDIKTFIEFFADTVITTIEKTEKASSKWTYSDGWRDPSDRYKIPIMQASIGQMFFNNDISSGSSMTESAINKLTDATYKLFRGINKQEDTIDMSLPEVSKLMPTNFVMAQMLDKDLYDERLGLQVTGDARTRINQDIELNISGILNFFVVTAKRVEEFEQHKADFIAAENVMKDEFLSSNAEDSIATLRGTLNMVAQTNTRSSAVLGGNVDAMIKVASKPVSYLALGFSALSGVGVFLAGQYTLVSLWLQNLMGNKNVFSVGSWVQAQGIMSGVAGAKTVNQIAAAITNSRAGDVMSFELLEKVDGLMRKFRILDMDYSKLAGAEHNLYGTTAQQLPYIFMQSADMFNKAVFMIAQMIEEGSWAAYSTKDGEVVYDEKLDARFKTPDGQLTRDYLARELGVKPGDTLPVGHDNNMMNKIRKQVADCFGTTTKEDQALARSITIMRAFSIFRTWIAAKLKRYWSGETTDMMNLGNLEIAVDENGNKYKRWAASFNEGIYMTFVNGYRLSRTVGASQVWANMNEAQRNNVYKATADTVVLASIFAMLLCIFDDDERNREKGLPAYVWSSTLDLRVASASGVVDSYKNTSAMFNMLASILSTMMQPAYWGLEALGLDIRTDRQQKDATKRSEETMWRRVPMYNDATKVDEWRKSYADIFDEDNSFTDN
jgi:hypothetical protein